MSEKIRVGILGCANIARRSLAPAFLAHPSFDLVAVASRTPEKAHDFLSSLSARVGKSVDGSNQPFVSIEAQSYDEILANDKIDLIYCPLPTGLHYEWVKKALLAGKHVLCEKSLACHYQEVSELVNLARAKRRLLMESFQFRFHAQNLYVKSLLEHQAIGELRQLTVRFGIPPFPEGASNIRYNRELGGGALLDNGAYTIKCSTYLLGGDIQVLAALEDGAVPSLGNVSLTGAIMLSANYKSQSTGSVRVPIQAAYGFDHFYQNSYELWGTKGKISTVRAFTAREDFAAPVIIETVAGRDVKTFNDDHFGRLMDYLAVIIPSGNYEPEYNECLIQARLLSEVAKKSNP